MTNNLIQNRKILVIDDDVNLCKSLAIGLKKSGANVITANNGKAGIKKLYDCRPDLVFLDVRMPEMNGWETCRQIRMLSNVPIIMLTSLTDNQDIVRGLKYGADDFVSKPFSREVLTARAEAVLRRYHDKPEETDENEKAFHFYQDERLEIDLHRRIVSVEGEIIKLSSTEFKLLSVLLENSGRIIPYESILDQVWGWDSEGTIGYIHVYVSRLRSKIEVDPRNPRYLVNERGYGYTFHKLG